METSSYETGQKLVAGVAIVTLAISLISVVLSLVTGTGQLASGVIRLLLTGGLCYSLMSGASWARWVAGILYLLGGIFSLVAGWAAMQMTPWGSLVLLLGAVYLVSAIILLFVPAVGEYFS